MNNYFFINSRDALTDIAVEQKLDLMILLLQESHGVDLLLVQDGIYAAQKNIDSKNLRKFLDKGGRIHVDDFSLSLREIHSDSLMEGVVIDSVSIVIDAMLEKQKVIWC